LEGGAAIDIDANRFADRVVGLAMLVARVKKDRSNNGVNRIKST
jgi:hypothetical protein